MRWPTSTDLREHTRFGTEVEALWWDEDATTGRSIRSTATARATSATPASSSPPPVTSTGRAGRICRAETRSTGISIHSALWDPALDLTGKRVAVIGAGCTAVQIVDACVEQVAHLTVFQRQPHWVAPRKRLTDDVPDHRRYLGRRLPYYANWHRLKSYWGTADNNYPIILQDPQWAQSHLSISPANDVLLQMCLEYIDRDLRRGNRIGEEGDAGLRAVRQAHHPRSRAAITRR